MTSSAASAGQPAGALRRHPRTVARAPELSPLAAAPSSAHRYRPVSRTLQAPAARTVPVTVTGGPTRSCGFSGSAPVRDVAGPGPDGLATDGPVEAVEPVEAATGAVLGTKDSGPAGTPTAPERAQPAPSATATAAARIDPARLVRLSMTG
jgi:hypothetical protein